MKSLISIGAIIVTLFMIVFVKMEIRRSGYEVLLLQRDLKKMQDDHLKYKLKMSEVLKPDYVREHATNMLELDWARSKQIIYLTGEAQE